MPEFLEHFNQRELLAYAQGRQYPALPGEQIFPETKRNSLKYDVIVGARKVPVAAKVHAFDTESQIIDREGAATTLELSLFKQKRQIKERDIMELNKARDEAELRQIEEDIYNEVDATREGVRAGIEVVRMQTLTYGKYNMKLEDGEVLEVDYHVPAENQLVMSGTSLFSNPEADIIGLLQAEQDRLGVLLPYALTSPEILGDILANNAIRDTMFRSTNLNVRPSLRELNEFLGERDLPQISVIRGYYREQNGRTFTQKRYFDKNYFVLMPEQTAGQTVYGPTPEEIRLLGRTDIQASEVGNILSLSYEESLDPVSSWTKSVALAMPSFPIADQVLQIKAGNR